MGKYIKGVLSEDSLRKKFLREMGVEGGKMNYRERVEEDMGEMDEGMEE